MRRGESEKRILTKMAQRPFQPLQVIKRCVLGSGGKAAKDLQRFAEEGQLRILLKLLFNGDPEPACKGTELR